jgi:hypothetical protein
MSRNAFNDLDREYNRRQEQLEIARDERERARKPYRCSDGFCGADDCQRCRPVTYWMGDEEEEE